MSKSSKPKLFSSHHHWYSSILNSLPPYPHPTTILYTYYLVVHGFAMSTPRTPLVFWNARVSLIPASPLFRPLGKGKIIGARTFYNGYESYMEKPIDEFVESKSLRDIEGHGTHTVSTTVGSVVANASLFHYAEGEARGMATKARIAAYKICWKLGCFDYDILAAIELGFIQEFNIVLAQRIFL
ncbi:subtilisin-like protease SBT1.4 [Senna tora]|uniref:Subtilisin-like protease SBT1.4 n=1 Tax=Senna tora TaxID=362788 RepID=A0A834XC45_9FABA|nr:subtilisin-like protease SBT1.4 [Senna tora]